MKTTFPDFFSDFNDCYLEKYIYQALENNHELKQADYKVKQYKYEIQKQFDDFIHAFEYNMSTDDNYDLAIDIIARFAEYMGIELPYLKFDEFDNAMKNKIVFKI